jgi:hypothetical protein
MGLYSAQKITKPKIFKVSLCTVNWIELNSCELIMPTRLRVYMLDTQKKDTSRETIHQAQIFSHLKFFWHSLKLSVKSPSLSPPIPSFSGIHNKVKNFLLNLIMKCWNSAFNAQGSRVIIVIVQVVGAVKIYVAAAAVEALRRKEGRRGWNSVLHQNWWKN